MSIEMKCPGCGKNYVLPDRQEGKRVRCTKCEESFLVESAGAKTRRGDEERTREKARPTASGSRARARDEDDRDEADRDGPRRSRAVDRKPAKKGGSGKMILFIVLGVIGVPLVVCCGGCGFMFWRSSHPSQDTVLTQNVEGLRAFSPFEREAAANRLADMPVDEARRKEVVAALQPLLHDPFPGPQDAAKRALGHWATPDDLVTMSLNNVKSLNHEDRVTGAKMLSTMQVSEGRRKEVSQALDNLLLARESDVYREALLALEVWGTADDEPAVARFLDSERSPLEKQWGVDVLAKLKDPRGADKIVLLINTRALDRKYLTDSLIAMGEVAEPAVIKLLQTGESTGRLEACKVLKVIGTKESIPALTAAAQDKNNVVLATAAKDAIATINSR